MKRLLPVLLVAAVFAGCARNPVSGRRQIVLVSEGQEVAMGAESHVQANSEYGFVDDPGVQRYLRDVGLNLSAVSHRPNLDWHFTVVDSPVVNAFAVPGGYVYFTRGILAYINSEAELAGVMGHEIGHVTARHSVSEITRSTFAKVGLGAASILYPAVGRFGDAADGALGVWFLRFSRNHEREADRLGVEYAGQAGYDPREVSNFFEVLRRLSGAVDRQSIPGWLSSHPDPGERVQATRTAAQDWILQTGAASDTLRVNHDDHFRGIDGIVFGNNPREGYLEESRFYHPDLEFEIEFPSGWQVENTRTAVYAVDSANGAQMELRQVDAPAGTTAESYARQLADSGVIPRSGRSVVIHGNRAFLGLYAITDDSGRAYPALAAFIEYGRGLYQVLGIMSNLQRYGNDVEASILSFQRLTDEKILKLQPDRLKIVEARQGDTIAGLAERIGNPRVGADELAILNRFPANQPIPPGRLVKVVDRGF